MATSSPTANASNAFLATTTTTPGRHLFIAGNIVLILFSATHMVPMLFDLFVEPTQPLEIEARRANSAIVVDMGPFHTTGTQLVQLLSTSYSALLFFVVAINLAALPAVAAHGRLRTLAMVNAIFVGLLLTISLIFQFPPPAVFALTATVLFLAAFARAPRATPSPMHR